MRVDHIDPLELDRDDVDYDDERIDTIGQNGNDGLHYDPEDNE